MVHNPRRTPCPSPAEQKRRMSWKASRTGGSAEPEAGTRATCLRRNGPTPRWRAAETSVCRHDDPGPGLMQDEPLDWIELAGPGRQFEDPARVRVAGLPTLADALRAEVHVLGMVLAIKSRRQQ